MILRNCAVLLAACFLVTSGVPRAHQASTDDPHNFFRLLVNRSDHWKSYSLRDSAMVRSQRDGGFAENTPAPIPNTVTYGPEVDPDPHRQDATKVVVPAFVPVSSDHVLRTGVTTSQTELPFQRALTANVVAGMSFKIDEEIVTVRSVDYGTSVVTVTRAQFGTTASDHAAGAMCHRSTNSLPTQARLPLGLREGSSYFVTWDSYFTDSFLNYPTHSFKTFQFSARGDRIWKELRTRFDGGATYPPFSPAPGYNRALHVFAVDMRSYQLPWNGVATSWSETDGNMRGPGNTNGSSAQPVLPFQGAQMAKANQWQRWFVEFTFVPGDWDRMRVWVATEESDAVMIYDIALSLPPASTGGVGEVDKFWIEYNSSQVQHIRGDTRDLVSYVRNLVVLRNEGQPGAWSQLLIRPSAGALLPPVTLPAVPRNLRIGD